MLTIIDLNAEFANLNMLQDRTPQTTAAERDKAESFARLMSYRDGAIFITKFAGSGHWERHPQGDEIVQIIEGTTTLHVVSDGRSEAFNLSAGAFVIIPQGAWHCFESADGVSLMTATPQPTEFATADDASPRTLNSPNSARSQPVCRAS